PTHSAYPAPGAAGTFDVAYLDVWQRDVSVYEDGDLREPALSGADTTTRVQTAWQVKVLRGDSSTTCDAPPTAWAITIAPSTARLSAQATPAAASTQPCVIDPIGGYVGLENHLYRVEVHKGGTLGGASPATFKWSRDGASLAATVLQPIRRIAADDFVITVASTGRDSWMRFERDDHIELLDDMVEFAMRDSDNGGPMATVLSVDHELGEIHVKPELNRDLSTFPIIALRHPRIRRWDYLAGSNEPLARPVSNGTAIAAIALERGITIAFGSSLTDLLHAGDYWVFAARTADGTIDTLV